MVEAHHAFSVYRALTSHLLLTEYGVFLLLFLQDKDWCDNNVVKEWFEPTAPSFCLKKLTFKPSPPPVLACSVLNPFNARFIIAMSGIEPIT